MSATDDPAQIGGVPTTGGWVPQPDPTALTATAVNTAKADLRRELAALRELIEARIGTIEASLSRNREWIEALPGQIHDQANSLHIELDRRLVAHETDAVKLRGEITTAVGNLERLHEERFTAIAQQFTERDVRSDQDKRSSKEALDAALLAQKESVSQQNDANTVAATKSETSFTKQIDQIGTLISTLEKSLTDRITELKERIDRGEGGATGRRESGVDARTWLLGLAVILVAVAGIVAQHI
jgi:chaperonin cofactor prefoldin